MSPPPPEKNPTVEPLPESATASILDSPEASIKEWYEAGLDLIAKNEVAVVLMAGITLSEPELAGHRR